MRWLHLAIVTLINPFTMARQSSRLKKAVVETAAAAETSIANTLKKGTPKAKATKLKVNEDATDDEALVAPVETKSAKKRKATQSNIEDGEPAIEEPKTTKKRKTAKAKTENLMALAKRTVINTLSKSMYIGAHVSSAGGM